MLIRRCQRLCRRPQIPLDAYCVMENVVQTGAVPVAPYATPSTDEVAESVAPLLASHDAMLLARHGALTVELILPRILQNGISGAVRKDNTVFENTGGLRIWTGMILTG